MHLPIKLISILISGLTLLLSACSPYPLTVTQLNNENTSVIATSKVFAEELKPSRIQIKEILLKSGQNLEDVIRRLPAGVQFVGGQSSASEKTELLWIPKVGQSGIYNLPQEIIGAGGQPITLEVFETQNNLNLGPPSGYDSEDLGYIFIHGKTDQDNCTNPADLANYWMTTPEEIAKTPNLRNIICYDGRKSIVETSPLVAEQIRNANCGDYNKCIIVTHSMGGLMLEHMLIAAKFAGTREKLPTDFPIYDQETLSLFRDLHQRTLFSINIASAAGGSKASNIVANPGQHALGQQFVGIIAGLLGSDTESTIDLQTVRSSEVLAPMFLDAGIPFFMIAGYSEQIADGTELAGLAVGIGGDVELFNASTEYAFLDGVASFASRSDGIVAFRSSCGIKSSNENSGPGRNSLLETHFEFCFQGEKKPNHFMWFVSNLNHTFIRQNPSFCNDSQNPCRHRFSSIDAKSGIVIDEANGRTPSQIISSWLSTQGPGRNLASP